MIVRLFNVQGAGSPEQWAVVEKDCLLTKPPGIPYSKFLQNWKRRGGADVKTPKSFETQW
jgi:hypothetical protein